MANNLVDMDIEEVPEIGSIVDRETGDCSVDTKMTSGSINTKAAIASTKMESSSQSSFSDEDDRKSLILNEDSPTNYCQFGIKEKIRTILESTKVGGSVATSKLASYIPAMPDLFVKGYGLIPLPVTETVAQGLRTFFEPAPYGLGEETLHDENVRCSWQMAPERFEIRNKEFLSVIKERVVNDVKEALGCCDSIVHVEIYKMLLYETGGHFKPHRDTEKSNGMFGTLIVQLPSLFTGGDLILSHNGRQEEIKFSHSRSTSTCMYVAHYSDVEHEITTVTSGYRLALVFSLCWNGNGIAPVGKHLTRQTQELTEMLQNLTAFSEPGMKIAWAMEHMYSLDSLNSQGIKALKGKDKLIAENLHNAIARMRYDERYSMYIAEYTKSEEMHGYCTKEEYYDLWGGYTSGNNSDENCFQSDDIEIIDLGVELEDFISTNGHLVKITNFKFCLAEDILNRDDMTDDEFWGEGISGSCSGPTGNAGATQTYWYHRYLLILWRESDSVEILKNDHSAAIKHTCHLWPDHSIAAFIFCCKDQFPNIPLH